MKKFICALATVGILFSGIAPAVAVDKPMHPAVEQLDLDGDFILFLNTEDLEAHVLETVEQIAALAAETSGNAEEVATAAAAVKKAIAWSGLLSLKAFAMSMAPAEGDLSRVVMVSRHDEADAGKALWRVIGSEPRALKGIRFAPADTVYAANSTASLNEAWKVINEGITEIGGPQAAAAFNQQLFMVQMVIGTNISVITESIDEDILISLQLSEEREIAFSADLTVPEPGVLIGFGVKNPVVKELLLQRLQLSGMPLTNTTFNAVELTTLNLPAGIAPIPLTPTLAMTDNYLLIGSTADTVKRALDAYANNNGMIASADYKRLLGHAPEKVSAVEYLAPRFMEVYMDGFEEALSHEPAAGHMLDLLDETVSEMCSGSYALNTAEGVYSVTLMNSGGMRPAEFMVTAYSGLIAAIAIPSYSEARTMSVERVCENNRRMLEAAKQMWAVENDKTEGAEPTKADLDEYLSGGFEALSCPAGGTYTINPVGTDCTCPVHP